jgi:hypothetical protein
MFRRTTGRRWRTKDLRGIPYEPVEPAEQTPAERAHSAAVPVCPECGQPRPDDERVAAGLRCENCET